MEDKEKDELIQHLANHDDYRLFIRVLNGQRIQNIINKLVAETTQQGIVPKEEEKPQNKEQPGFEEKKKWSIFKKKELPICLNEMCKHHKNGYCKHKPTPTNCDARKQ